MVLALLQANPTLPIQSYGSAVGSALICTGLFIWSQIQIFQLKKTVESNTQAIKSSNEELKATLEGQVAAQRELAQSVHQLAEAIHHQSDMHSEQLQLIREMVVKQEVLAANQTSLMTGLQRVVEQLIDVVKG